MFNYDIHMIIVVIQHLLCNDKYFEKIALHNEVKYLAPAYAVAEIDFVS